jgi:hypothetical protein
MSINAFKDKSWQEAVGASINTYTLGPTLPKMFIALGRCARIEDHINYSDVIATLLESSSDQNMPLLAMQAESEGFVSARLIVKYDLIKAILTADKEPKAIQEIEPFIFNPNDRFTVGRDEKCNLVVPKSCKTVSRRHLQFIEYPPDNTALFGNGVVRGTIIQGIDTKDADPTKGDVELDIAKPFNSVVESIYPNKNGSTIIYRNYNSKSS